MRLIDRSQVEGKALTKVTHGEVRRGHVRSMSKKMKEKVLSIEGQIFKS